MRLPARTLSVLVASLALAACSGADATPSTPLGAPATEVRSPTWSRTDVERDLVLTLRRTTAEPFELSRNPRFEVVLANRSRDRAYPIVLSNDGSESGWREPHVWYTVERKLAGATWETAPALPGGRCGLYARDWEKDVRTLAPETEVVLPWFHFYEQWALEEATHLRVVAHYAYGDHAKDLRKVPPALHMIPAYEIASKPMELAVEAPVTLEVRLKGRLPDSGEALAPLVDVLAINHSKTAQSIAMADSGGSLSLEVEYTAKDGRAESTRISTSHSTSYARDMIAPGARMPVVGSAKAQDYSSLPEGAKPRRVRAVMSIEWETPGGPDARIMRSPWVDVK